MEESLEEEKQSSEKALASAMKDLQYAQACIKGLEDQLQEAKSSNDHRLLRAKADAEHDRERQASRAGDLVARIAEIEAQWEVERVRANLQVPFESLGQSERIFTQQQAITHENSQDLPIDVTHFHGKRAAERRDALW